MYLGMQMAFLHIKKRNVSLEHPLFLYFVSCYKNRGHGIRAMSSSWVASLQLLISIPACLPRY